MSPFKLSYVWVIPKEFDKLDDDLAKIPDEEKGDTLEYNPKEYFDDSFQT